MAIVGGLDLHRKQITFDVVDTGSGTVGRGRVTPADRESFRRWAVSRILDAAYCRRLHAGIRYLTPLLAWLPPAEPQQHQPNPGPRDAGQSNAILHG